MVKEDNNLYRKGDAFYSEEGEFVYRVPGLDKKASSTWSCSIFVLRDSIAFCRKKYEYKSQLIIRN